MEIIFPCADQTISFSISAQTEQALKPEVLAKIDFLNRLLVRYSLQEIDFSVPFQGEVLREDLFEYFEQKEPIVLLSAQANALIDEDKMRTSSSWYLSAGNGNWLYGVTRRSLSLQELAMEAVA